MEEIPPPGRFYSGEGRGQSGVPSTLSTLVLGFGTLLLPHTASPEPFPRNIVSLRLLQQRGRLLASYKVLRDRSPPFGDPGVTRSAPGLAKPS